MIQTPHGAKPANILNRPSKPNVCWYIIKTYIRCGGVKRQLTRLTLDGRVMPVYVYSTLNRVWSLVPLINLQHVENCPNWPIMFSCIDVSKFVIIHNLGWLKFRCIIDLNLPRYVYYSIRRQSWSWKPKHGGPLSLLETTSSFALIQIIRSNFFDIIADISARLSPAKNDPICVLNHWHVFYSSGDVRKTPFVGKHTLLFQVTKKVIKYSKEVNRP